MKRLLIALSLLLLALCFAPACQAGGAVVVRGGLFRPRVVVNNGFHGNAVVVNRGFVQPRVVVNGFGFNNRAVVVNGFGGHGFVGQSVFAPRAVVVNPFGGGCVNGSCGVSGLFLAH